VAQRQLVVKLMNELEALVGGRCEVGDPVRTQEQLRIGGQCIPGQDT